MKDDVGLQKDQVLGKCKIEYMLGSGAMGVVYLALHQNLQIYVAVKVLPLSLTENNPDLAERFLREAQIMARIRDSHVVTVMDAGQDELTGLCYIVLELVTGGNLGDRIRDNGPMDERMVLQIG
ncbi:MAG TPA: protein kinase, partial [Candidatus Methylacidiphilales bacterium]|nr:protein kinase [Candidatus Methylacidiphilales bacterium]